MKIQVELELMVRLVECIEKQRIMAEQTEEIQDVWKQVINTTVGVAKASLLEFRDRNGYGNESTELGTSTPSADKTQFI